MTAFAKFIITTIGQYKADVPWTFGLRVIIFTKEETMFDRNLKQNPEEKNRRCSGQVSIVCTTFWTCYDDPLI